MAHLLPPLRIATLNVWGGFGDWPARLAALVEAWPSVNADVLCVQEVRRAPGVCQLDDLARSLGYAWSAFEVGERRGGGEVEGVGILSRVELTPGPALALPASDPVRVAARATVRHSEQTWAITSAHLAFDEPARSAHLQELLAAQPRGTRWVIGGDLNITPEDIAPRLVSIGARDVLAVDAGPTWPVDGAEFARCWAETVGEVPTFSLAPRRLDYLLTGGAQAVGAGIDRLGDTRRGYASDHAAVWADLA